MDTEPAARPRAPFFSSGPCAKRPGWSLDQLRTDALGRSHRAKLGKARLKLAIDLTREVLQVPADYRIGIVPASDTGAVEMALWSLLGAAPRRDAGLGELRRRLGHGCGEAAQARRPRDQGALRRLPDLSQVDTKTRDVVFTWNGTTSGVRVPNADWIAADREGITICDATSSAFAQRMDFAKLDVVTFSWQKVLGGEAAHGMLILSPRAVERLQTYTPDRALPKIFRLTSGGKLTEGVFQGETINTPSMLAVEDYIDALQWAKGLGGLDALVAKADGNARVLADWVERTPWVANLAADPATASNTSVCLQIVDADVKARGPEAVAAVAKGIASALEKEGAAYDIGAYRDAPPGLRIWCGATVEASDLEALTPWLDWAFAQEKAKLAQAA
jgi:phosphoserine aminotransferase